ncbi:MAG: hypothetical protein UY40_C0001G0040 [candidate division CPR1 bacterium GW2011_GWC1_49_13]|uniref:Uncharacterized protein n=1 Tax=candidate division CPR1 bacterium GW2011_GWC1_49_13 TaxID=1618342 RepID=A0A0G1XUJ3_9BACT|nr:MAG: hypothetical protein UY40_C0001G0040 [candidate division CPR1 bacterium GW2011_GWC1_49_13]
MKLIDQPISLEDLKNMAVHSFGNLVKAVVDIEKEVMVVDAELHSDEEAHLLEKGSKQKDLWGINLYPELTDKDFIEFDSVINLRPSYGNKTRSVDDQATREKISNIVAKLIEK